MLNDSNRIFVAKTLAQLGHNGQVDKVGERYFEHVERVALANTKPSEIIAGYLHDIVEDGHMTHEALEKLNVFTKEELEAIKLLDKKWGLGDAFLTFQDAVYYSRIKGNPTARMVKLADLKDNMDASRFEKAGKKMTKQDHKRMEDYARNYKFLLLLNGDSE